MAEYLKDDDGDVWERRGSDMWAWEMLRFTRSQLEADYGPLTPCDVDGNPLNSEPADDVRALLANAFDDLKRRMDVFPTFSIAQTIPDAITSQVAEWVGVWAAGTADGLRL